MSLGNRYLIRISLIDLYGNRLKINKENSVQLNQDEKLVDLINNLFKRVKVLEYFTQLLGLKNEPPTHDYLSVIFASIDSKKFMEVFIEWIKDNQKQLRKQVKPNFESYNNLYGNPRILHDKTIEKSHGIIAVIECFLSYSIS